MPYTYDYPRPALTVDCIIFSQTESGDTYVLLIERDREPFAGYWAFPGGFVDEDEPVEEAALRELQEETGLEIKAFELLGVFSKPGRDPRGWVVSIAYVTQVDKKDWKPIAADDARKAEWVKLEGDLRMAFDHDEILDKALIYLKKPG